ncbi:hypothetical protein BDW74DRAFT_8265 [Aspergillus multicolor]|uniref:uncharacterized protein n=1 Tax=Aspergillus multicolor TaxID=41759 RepID=UPI003CCC92C3
MEHDEGLSLDPLYASGGKGSMRYFFLHGGHASIPSLNEIIVEAKVVVLRPDGKILFDNAPDQPTSQYRFVNRKLDWVDGNQDAYVPARLFVQALLQNTSIPTLLFAEIRRDQVLAVENIGAGIEQENQFLYVVILTLGRTNLTQASFHDYEYLKSMLHLFLPSFAQAVARISDAYLPGDASNLCREIAGLMTDSQNETGTFLALYAKRYGHEALAQEEVLERCLMHIVKMPFELGSSVRYGLVSY